MARSIVASSAAGRWPSARPAAAAVPTALAIWACWPSIAAMIGRWSADPRYAHGFVVPIFAAWLWWSRRGEAAGDRGAPSAWGLAWVAAGLAMRVLGSRYHLGWVNAMALLPLLAGAAMVTGGRRTLIVAWPSVAFLAFMVPLPYRAEVALGAPMQRLACSASTYALQCCGIPATAEGSVIALDDGKVNVAEACNGMGMMYMFLAFSAGLALASARPPADRALIVATAPAVALAANVARIVATGVLFQVAGDEAAERLYHDLAGWLMMPLALAALSVELWILSRLFVEAGPASAPARPSTPRGPGLFEGR